MCRERKRYLNVVCILMHIKYEESEWKLKLVFVYTNIYRFRWWWHRWLLLLLLLPLQSKGATHFHMYSQYSKLIRYFHFGHLIFAYFWYNPRFQFIWMSFYLPHYLFLSVCGCLDGVRVCVCVCDALQCVCMCLFVCLSKMYTSIIFTLCARHHKVILPNSTVSQQNRKVSRCWGW